MTWLNLIVLATALSLPKEAPQNSAIGNAQRAVTTAQNMYGPKHPATAMMLRNLALCYENAGLHSRAEAAATRSLAILEDTFGTKDVSLTPALNVLTEVYVAESRWIDAERFGRRAVAIGPEAEAHYATALHNLGAVNEALGRMNEARALYGQALAAREKWLSANHPFVALTRTALERVDARSVVATERASALR